MNKILHIFLAYSTLIALGILCIPSAPVYANGDLFHDRLENNTIWHTILFKYENGAIEGPFNKKWRVEKIKGKILLRELLETTFAFDIKNKVVTHSATTIDISGQQINLDHFMHLPKNSEQESFHYEQLGSNSFALKLSKSGYSLVFRRSQDFSTDQKPILGKGIWLAPLSANRNLEILKLMPSLADLTISYPKDTAYLHHEFNHLKKILVSTRFPSRFIETLKQSLEKWNSALPSKVFDEKIVVETLKPEICFGAEVLCLDWQGPENFAWSGYSAVGLSTYDPQSGIIVGGMITISNQATIDTPNNVNPETLTKTDVVRMVLNRETYLKMDRPDDCKLVMALLLHEIGHYNGFEHDHHGTLTGTVEKPTNTIMAYPPFPVIQNVTELQENDIDKIDLVYSKKNRLENYVECNDLQSLPIKINGYYQKADPKCNQYTLGDPLEWYTSLAQLGAQGSMTQIPFGFIIPFIPIELNKVATHLGFFVQSGNANETYEAKLSLCQIGNKDWQSYLKEKLNLDVECGR